jgi:hypothetical protein
MHLLIMPLRCIRKRLAMRLEGKAGKKLQHELIAQDSVISNSPCNIKTIPLGNDQSHVISVEPDHELIQEESFDENQIVEQDPIHELCYPYHLKIMSALLKALV